MDFKDKVILITGACSGIGAATSIYLAGLGAKLALTGKNEINLQKTTDECTKKGAEVYSIPGDLSIEDHIEKILKGTIERFNRLDVLVNNAGFGIFANLESMKLLDFDGMFRINVRAVLHLTKLAMPHLIASKGNVVNVSSATSLRAYPSGIAYAMSKAALDHFTRSLAFDVASKLVRVNSVNPGPVHTGFQKRSRNVEDDTAVIEMITKNQHFARVGTVEEVAAAIAFLASDLSSNTTGVILNIDGGSSLGKKAN